MPIPFWKLTSTILLAAYLGLWGWDARGECLGLTKGKVAFDVAACEAVSPRTHFDKDTDYTFYKNLPPAEQKKFMNSYKGYLLQGTVVKSDAVKSGLSAQKGALSGEKIKVFTPASQTTCNTISGKRVLATVNESCCAGAVDVPCLLKTNYVLSEIKVLGNANSAAGDKQRMAAKKSKLYINGVRAFKKKRYKVAAKFLSEAQKQEELDVKGYFLLGLTYRNLDLCRKAIPVLKTIFDRSEKKDVWADEESTVRKSNFLLARCYAMTNEAGKATIILNSYLIQPGKYQSEIRESLKHPDFGWINSTKEYRDYTESARKVMR